MEQNKIDTAITGLLQKMAGHHYALISLLLTLIVLFVIPFKIASYGYRPGADAMRHSAHALDDRNWDKIVIQRDSALIDTNPGWDFILRSLHRMMNWDQEDLLVFSLVSLCVLYLLTGLFLINEPLGWLCGLLAGLLTSPGIIMRINYARPFIVTICCMMCIMMVWRSPQRSLILRLLITAFLFALCTWIHGSWYLAILIPAAFFLSGQFVAGFWLTLCWLIGSFAGAMLTGHPLIFLYQQTTHALLSLGADLSQRYLVGEFKPALPEALLLGVVALTILVRMRYSKRTLRSLTVDPLFVLFILGSILGISVRRFSLDWGRPAAVLWMACQWKDIIKESKMNIHYPLYGLGILSVTLLTFYYAVTADVNGRWTNNLNDEFIDAADPALNQWLPGTNGIVYSDSMTVFFRTYFNNPKAPWRYILGYESGLMPADDLKIFRRIQWNRNIPASFKPWVEKMRREDRLILLKNGKPVILGLEWHLAARDTWIGKKKDNPGKQ